MRPNSKIGDLMGASSSVNSLIIEVRSIENAERNPKEIANWMKSIDELGRNPERLATMSVAARNRVADKFGLKRMAGSYARLIEDMAHQRPTIALPLPMDEWATPLGLRAGLRTYLPAPVKNWLRVARERWYRNPSRDAA